jgi:hypothetical protein
VENVWEYEIKTKAVKKKLRYTNIWLRCYSNKTNKTNQKDLRNKWKKDKPPTKQKDK